MADGGHGRGIGGAGCQHLGAVGDGVAADLHPRGSSEFARKVLVQVLRHAPASATPGNMVPIRCFNVDTGKPQYLQIPDAYTRPEHFLRPVTDENFATSGELTYCRGKDGFLPDDMLHCANVVSTAMFLRCKVRDLTTDTLRGYYQLMPKRWYPLAQFSMHPNSPQGKLLYVHGNHSVVFIYTGERATRA